MKLKNAWKGTLIIFMIISILLPNPVKAKERKIVRVAYPIMEGLTMKDQDGNYYGYDYDFLMQIAQYTGWEYEFVEVEGDINERLTKMMEMTKQGEIDLMGDMKYMESLLDSYDYASEPYGNAYNILAVRNDSNIIDYTSLANKKNLRIAMIASAGAREEKLKQYAQSNGIQYEKVICNSSNELDQAIEEGRADAILTVDLSMPKGYYSVARFSPDPFYFVTTKGNAEIMTELNQALTSIAQSNPTLSSTLYNRYFTGNGAGFVLNEREQSYVEMHPVLKVLSRGENAPVQYLDQGVVKGIGKDILDKISEKTGLKFEYYTASSYEEYQQLLQEESIDLLLGVSYESSMAEKFDVNLSNPYLTSDLVLATNEKVLPNELSGKLQGITSYSDERYDTHATYQIYESVEEIMLALDDGNLDYAYLNTYQVTYYRNKYHLKNVNTYQVADYLRSQYAFGITRSEDLSLVSIMNKAIRSLDEEMNTYIYNNAYVEKGFDLYTFIEEHAAAVIITSVLVLIGIIQLIRIYYRRQLKMKKAVELEYQRYQLLSEITGEMTFSYEYALDELRISRSGMQRLASQKIVEGFMTLACRDGIQALLSRYFQEKQDVNDEVAIALLDGEEKWYSITMKVICDIDKNHTRAIYAIGKVLDIQKEKQEREQLLQKSYSDVLTGVLNRAGAREQINNALQSETQGALIMLDLDCFKDVNDQYGHVSGDEVLAQTAQLLTAIFAGDIIARLGGDEFIIYVYETHLSMLEVLCQQAVETVKQLPCMQGKEQQLTMSMGVVLTSKGDDLTQLMEQADEGLYEVKRNGKNDFHIKTA